MERTAVFISHSHQDNDWCRAFASALASIGYDVWYDESALQGGAAWVANIQHEIQSRKVFLVILTPESWASKWVQDELQLAIATRRRIMPVLLRNTNEVSGFLLTIQWIKVVGESAQAAARAVVIAIEAPPAPGRNATPQASETLDALLTLCKSLAAEKRYTEALSACDRALGLDSNNAEIYRVKGDVMFAINEYSKAASAYIQRLLRVPNDHATFSNCANALGFMASAHEMLQVYWTLRSIDPSSYITIKPLLEGLNRLASIDAVVGPLLKIDDRSSRGYAVGFLREHQRHDLAIRICDDYYRNGTNTNTANAADLDVLAVYAADLQRVGRIEDANWAHALIIRVFETTYGNPPVKPVNDKSYSWYETQYRNSKKELASGK